MTQCTPAGGPVPVAPVCACVYRSIHEETEQAHGMQPLITGHTYYRATLSGVDEEKLINSLEDACLGTTSTVQQSGWNC